MKKKIHRYLLLTTFLTLAATLVLAVAIFHNMYRERIIDDMRTYADVLGSMVSSGEELAQRYQSNMADAKRERTESAGEGTAFTLRVTAISADGEVLYDSQTDDGVMENHAQRPEFIEAKEKGEGYSVRHSDTLGSDMYYAAVRLKNGDILRISKEENSIWSVFRRTIYGILAIAALMFLVCLVLSRYITSDIVRPIERLAREIGQEEKDEFAAVNEKDIYEELAPFILTIRQQHADIIKGAQMRQEFTANVSHELKTPLTSISGYAELIETGLAGQDETPRFAKEIHRSSDRLLALINDIIRLSELDGGQLEFTREELDLHEIAQTCVEMLQVSAANHSIRIQCHGHRSMVHADRGMMEELLYNLCDNAIRYNCPGGRVDVRVESHGSQVVLSVKDTGIGIPKESQERVFERFYRVDKSRSKSTGGTGLGLAIVKHIVALHQAQLTLQSEVGKGTEITVVF